MEAAADRFMVHLEMDKEGAEGDLTREALLEMATVLLGVSFRDPFPFK